MRKFRVSEKHPASKQPATTLTADHQVPALDAVFHRHRLRLRLVTPPLDRHNRPGRRQLRLRRQCVPVSQCMQRFHRGPLSGKHLAPGSEDGNLQKAIGGVRLDCRLDVPVQIAQDVVGLEEQSREKQRDKQRRALDEQRLVGVGDAQRHDGLEEVRRLGNVRAEAAVEHLLVAAQDQVDLGLGKLEAIFLLAEKLRADLRADGGRGHANALDVVQVVREYELEG